jgi:hypothetical protein
MSPLVDGVCAPGAHWRRTDCDLLSRHSAALFDPPALVRSGGFKVPSAPIAIPSACANGRPLETVSESSAA